MPKPEFPGGIIKLLLDHDGEMMRHHENQEKRIDGYADIVDRQNAIIDTFCNWFSCPSCPLWQQGDDLKWRCGR